VELLTTHSSQIPVKPYSIKINNGLSLFLQAAFFWGVKTKSMFIFIRIKKDKVQIWLVGLDEESVGFSRRCLCE